MLITLDPVILRIGPFAVRWFGLLALLGLAVAVAASLRVLERRRISRKRALDALAWGLPAGLIAARGIHVLGWWDYYLTHAAELQQFNLDGLSLWGGLVGGGLVGYARLRVRGDGLRRRRLFDAVAPYVALGIGIGRVGAFLDGHGQGVPADVPWATAYANRLAATPDFGVPRHPVQLYDALIGLGLYVVLSRLPGRWPAGARSAILCVVLAASRLALGPVRLDPPFLFGLQIEQLLALGVLVFGLWYAFQPFVRRRRTDRRLPAAGQPHSREDPLAA